MKKLLFGTFLGFIITTLLAFTVVTYEPQKRTAEVEQIQGLYVFAKSTPVTEYEYLGSVKGPFIGNHEFDNLVELFIKKVKNDFPSADAIIFDGVIKQTHNTKVSAIKFK